MIRYGGIYARHREIDKLLHRAVAKEKHHVFRSFNQWRTAILSSFGYDPCNALTVGTKWNSLNSTITTSAFPSKNLRESHVQISWKAFLCMNYDDIISLKGDFHL